MPAFPLICPACTKVITPSNETVKPWGDDGPVLHSECATYIHGTYRELEVAHSTLAPSVLPSVSEMSDPAVLPLPRSVPRPALATRHSPDDVIMQRESFENFSVSSAFGPGVTITRTTGGSTVMITLAPDEAARVAAFILRRQRARRVVR